MHLFEARATPRTSAKPAFETLAASSLARSRASPRRVRIFEAQRCTRETRARFFEKKVTRPVRKSSSRARILSSFWLLVHALARSTQGRPPRSAPYGRRFDHEDRRRSIAGTCASRCPARTSRTGRPPRPRRHRVDGSRAPLPSKCRPPRRGPSRARAARESGSRATT
jgi:hypothetical protein